VDADTNQFAGSTPENRLVLTNGKFAVVVYSIPTNTQTVPKPIF